MKDALDQLGAISALLQAFFSDARTGTIIGLIVLDLVTGVIAALKLGTFDLQKLFTVYRTNVVPGVLGYAVVWLFSYFGVADMFGEVTGAITNYVGAGVVVASLLASIRQNLQRYSAPLTQPEVSEMYPRTPANPQG